MASRIMSRGCLRSNLAAPQKIRGAGSRFSRAASTGEQLGGQRLWQTTNGPKSPHSGRRDTFNPLDSAADKRARAEEVAYYKRRMRFAGIGVAFSFFGMILTVYLFPIETPKDRLDAPTSSPPFPDQTPVVGLTNTELVETGTSTIPYFPRTITLPATESTKTAALPSGIGDADSEYTLLGLGVRTVSFLGIQVYVVGIYCANSDLTALQAAFIKEGANAESASTLIAGEKDALRKRLHDPEDGEQIWERVLEKSGARSVVRIVPTRNTDFPHLRDGFERGINARVKARPGIAEDETLGDSVQQFKGLFGKGKLGKGEVMLLERGRAGELKAWIQEKKEGNYSALGEVKDERISRFLWLGYLGGKTVASEPCRKSVIDGVMAVVGRPIGSAETQVV